MNALLLLLLDSRSPAGAHNHSAGMEAAITTGAVRDQADVERFCRARLRTAGRVAADFAAEACALALAERASPAAPERTIGVWDALEAELDARTPSEAMRASSRQLGRGLTRMVRSMLPGFAPAVTHHPLVLGAAIAAAGGDPALAAQAAALGAISVPASAAVRLLGLDPFAAQSMLARLTAEIVPAPSAERPSAERPGHVIDSGMHAPGRPEPAAGHERSGTDAAAHSSPALDLLADFHLTTEVRLFAS